MDQDVFSENQDLKVTETSTFGLWTYTTFVGSLAMAAENTETGSTKPNPDKNKNSGNVANIFALKSSNTENVSDGVAFYSKGELRPLVCYAPHQGLLRHLCRLSHRES